MFLASVRQRTLVRQDGAGVFRHSVLTLSKKEIEDMENLTKEELESAIFGATQEAANTGLAEQYLKPFKATQMGFYNGFCAAKGWDADTKFLKKITNIKKEEE